MEVTYTCPSCGAAMVFDGGRGKLHCAYCGTDIGVEAYEARQKGTHTAAGEAEEQKTDGTEKARAYHCESCGAQLVTDEHTSATICAFCGNPTLVKERLEGEFLPDTLIPFQIDKTEAKARVRKWMAQGILTPAMLKKESTIDKITGIYVPFWLYDFMCEDDMQASAVRTHSQRKGDYIYHYSEHFNVRRKTKGEFNRIPADASQQMPDELMDKLEPFDYRTIVPFAMPYLSGYLSEKYNYTGAQIQNRAQERARDYITDMTRETITGYTSVSVTHNDVRAWKTKEEYALLPVWVLHYRYKQKDYQLFMNGQSGKIVADRPVSNGRSLFAGTAVFAISLLAMSILEVFM